MVRFLVIIISFFLLSTLFAQPSTSMYRWLDTYNERSTLEARILPPDGYQRISVSENDFAYWLRQLPLKPGKPAVTLYNGEHKWNQSAHYAVVNIDVGNQNLQQCADAIIRLRAEYLFAANHIEQIEFTFTSGHSFAYSDWKEGVRPIVSGNNVQFSKTQSPDDSYSGFKKYLNILFSYCGTYSLSKEMETVSDVQDIQIGDVFIQGGFPGHAVIVVDMAIHETTGEKIFLLAQSYMPAQDVHLLVNPNSATLSPWYAVNMEETLQTPEWTFQKSDHKRFE